MNAEEKIIGIIRDFKTDRPVMDADNTEQRYMELLQGEVDELKEAKTLEEKAEEYSDVVIYALDAMLHLGLDPVEEILTKLAINQLQHEARFYQEGDFETQRVKAKQFAKETGIKKIVYEAE